MKVHFAKKVYLCALTHQMPFLFSCQVLLSGLIGVVSWKRPLSLVVSELWITNKPVLCSQYKMSDPGNIVMFIRQISGAVLTLNLECYVISVCLYMLWLHLIIWTLCTAWHIIIMYNLTWHFAVFSSTCLLRSPLGATDQFCAGLSLLHVLPSHCGSENCSSSRYR